MFVKVTVIFVLVFSDSFVWWDDKAKASGKRWLAVVLIVIICPRQLLAAILSTCLTNKKLYRNCSEHSIQVNKRLLSYVVPNILSVDVVDTKDVSDFSWPQARKVHSCERFQKDAVSVTGSRFRHWFRMGGSKADYWCRNLEIDQGINWRRNCRCLLTSA